MSDYNLIVIGAGPGGYNAALRAAKLGLKTMVVDAREAGGTCLNRGCVPTKALLHASSAYREIAKAEEFGIHAGNVEVNLGEVFDYKNRITSTLSQGIEGLFKGAKIPFVKGRGRILEPGLVEVVTEEGEVTRYTGDNILIATGSVPMRPPIPGLDLPGVLTSDEILEGDSRLYESIVIIGGGVIGVELATFYAEMGSKVTIVEGLERLLPNMDKELGQNLSLILKKQGVEINTGAMVQRVEESPDGLKVVFESKGEEKEALGEKVLCAIGRMPFTEGLFTENLQPEMAGRRIKVDENFQTSLPGVYAIGDVSSEVQLAHVAAVQGIFCVEKLAGVTPEVNLNLIPGCIYCSPEIASIGMTEAEAKEKGIPVKVGKCVMGGNARTLILGAPRSFMKVVGNGETGRIIGAQLMCTNASDMISQLGVAIAKGMSPKDLMEVMRPHPTYEEALEEALLDLSAKLTK